MGFYHASNLKITLLQGFWFSFFRMWTCCSSFSPFSYYIIFSGLPFFARVCILSRWSLRDACEKIEIEKGENLWTWFNKRRKLIFKEISNRKFVLKIKFLIAELHFVLKSLFVILQQRVWKVLSFIVVAIKIPFSFLWFTQKITKNFHQNTFTSNFQHLFAFIHYQA